MIRNKKIEKQDIKSIISIDTELFSAKERHYLNDMFSNIKKFLQTM